MKKVTVKNKTEIQDMITICFTDQQYSETLTILQGERDRVIDDVEQ